MILNGKTLDHYKIWFDKYYNDYWTYYQSKPTILNSLIIDLFDSVVIYIEISFYDDCYWTYNIYSNKPVLEKEIANICNNRQEALTEAIKKANEIYNEKI